MFKAALDFVASRGMGRALRHRDFALYAVFGWFSSLGLWVQRTAVMWLTWELTRSGFWLGAMAIGEIVPYVLFAPLAGAVADRFDRLQVARASQIGAMIVTAVLTFLAFTGQVTVEVLFVLIMFSGGAETFWTATRMAMPPNLVPKEDVAAALSIGALSFNVSIFVGPAIFGFIISHWDVPWAFAFNTLTFALYFVALLFIRLRIQEPHSRRGRNIVAEIAEGIAYTLRHPGIAILLPVMLLSAVCLRGYRDLLAGISDTVYQQGAQGFAVLLAATGIGAILASLYLGNFAKVKGLTDYVTLNQTAAVAAIVVLGLVDDYWIGVVCSAVLGWCITTIGIGAQILLQTAVRGEMRGRVMSIWSIVVRAGPALGALIAGAAAEWWGFQIPLMTLAVLFLVPLAYFFHRRGHVASNMEVGPEEAPGAKSGAPPPGA